MLALAFCSNNVSNVSSTLKLNHRSTGYDDEIIVLTVSEEYCNIATLVSSFSR